MVGMNTIIFTDGSSRGNPGPGGWGAIIWHGDRVIETGGREESTTNNRMELTAVIEALKMIGKIDGSVHVYSDSSYVINGSTKWINGWVQNEWKTKEEKDVLNRDLWEVMLNKVKEYDIVWHNVAGHSGIPGNERADQIATSFADMSDTGLFVGDKETYTVDLEKREGDEILKKKKAHSGAKAFSYVSLVDGEVQVHKTWLECKARVDGKKAKFRKVLSKAEEDALVAEWSK